MPIIGLTDRIASFPQIGVLRKGGEKKDERRPGPDLKHFRFNTEDNEAADTFRQVYGDEPRAIRVFVPFATVAENFEAWQEEWTAGSLKHRCDGQTCVRWLKPLSSGKSEYSTEPKPCPGGCKPTGRLKVIIPELKRLAYVTVLTTSIHDIMTIQSNLSALESAREDLRGIPMLLRRSPREISTPNGSGQRVRREKWLISIEAQPSWVELQLTAQQRAALPTGSAQLSLPPAPTGDEDEDDFAQAEPATKPAPLRAVPAAQATVEAEAVDAEAIDDTTMDAILKLWPDYGFKKDEQVQPLTAWLKANKHVNALKELPAETGVKMLHWLQQRALAAQQAGLDQWACGRALAMQVLQATERAEAAGITEEQWRTELAAFCGDDTSVKVSRKELNADQAEGWAGLLNDWAAANEAKAAAA